MATNLDWSQCPAVESIPGKVSGAWIFRGTRVPVSAVFENLKTSSVEEILENFHVTREQVQTVLTTSLPRAQSRSTSSSASAMRIILDESVPQKLRLLIDGDHMVVTTWFQGWSGLTNGALLSAAEEEGFQLFITSDQEIRYQQNLTDRKIALVVLSTNNWASIRSHIVEIMMAINAVTPGGYTEVKIPE